MDKNLLVLLAGLAIGWPASGVSAPDRSYVEGQVLVRFKPAVSLESAHTTARQCGAELTRRFPAVSQSQGCVCALVRSSSKNTMALLAALQSDPSVALVEPDFIRHTMDLRPPSDPRFGQLWGLRNSGQWVNGVAGTAHADIEFLKAWGMARVATNTIVAVIDTGVEVTHPDLIANIWTNRGEIAANGLDDDGNGVADDAVGFDFFAGVADPSDSGYHGTHVAGTVAATGQNNLGVIGVAFGSQVLALKASADGYSFADSAIIGALDYCTMMKQRGTNIVAINASFGGPSESSSVRDAIQTAGDAGIIFCAAAGNSATNNDVIPTYPASLRLSNMIVVAASDQYDALADFSNYGLTTVDLAAPGVNILSALPLNQAGTVASVLWSNTTYSASEFLFSGTTTGITATIYNCGLGYPEDFPPAVSGNIALIRRGEIFFSDKVANAMTAGAQAVIIYNTNASSIVNGTLQFPNDWIPTVSVSLPDGRALTNAAPTIGTVVNAPDPAEIYYYREGTSMAAPHVAGAVAFAAMSFPDETVAQRRARILQHVTPVPGLSGAVITGGRLNLARVVDTDRNGLPDWWEQEHFQHLTGTNPDADADGDGASNLAEWRAGTNPTDPQSCLRLTAWRNANGLNFSWPSSEGRFYRLWATTNLAGGFGEPVFTNLDATPPQNVLPTGALLNAARYYRLEVEP